MTGRTIAHFRIGDKLGEGGMGIGLLAEDFRWPQIGNDNARSLPRSGFGQLIGEVKSTAVEGALHDAGRTALG
ncbi:MAG: hypothetical protein OEV33_00655 [Armatimonadota bacterium]|nr:hypothetical protein [Armatimonadota bacterium]